MCENLQKVSQAIIAEFKRSGICKVEITLSGAESAAGTTKDYALLAICNDDESIYNYVLEKLEKCRKPKDLRNIIVFLRDKKCIQSKEMYERNLTYFLLDRAPNYVGKYGYESVRRALYR